jgi:acetate kinase
VHGGSRYAASVRIDDQVLAYLETLNNLAPLHQPANLAGVRAFAAACPGVPQIACFDTAFHATTSELEKRFALPESFYEQGVRRYGFHGLSYRYVSERLAEVSHRGRGRLLLAHLGNGASLCGVREGRGVVTSMGFSALDGLMMGTRSGAIDAGVLLHLMRQGWDLERLEALLHRESGLRGVSGLSGDWRTLRASRDAQAAFALALFTHRLRRELGAQLALLGGLDLLAFTGGIGEHDALLREQAAQALACTGLRLDPHANAAAQGERGAAHPRRRQPGAGLGGACRRGPRGRARRLGLAAPRRRCAACLRQNERTPNSPNSPNSPSSMRPPTAPRSSPAWNCAGPAPRAPSAPPPRPCWRRCSRPARPSSPPAPPPTSTSTRWRRPCAASH